MSPGCASERLTLYPTLLMALEEWGSYVDDDAGDTPGWRYPSFTLHYPQEDGSTIAVDWRIKGLSPEEAARLVSRPARSAS